MSEACNSCKQMKSENRVLRKALQESSNEITDARNRIIKLEEFIRANGLIVERY